MRTVRIALTAILMAVMLLGQGSAAQAGIDTNHYLVQVNKATIPWLFAVGSFCEGVPEGIEISPDDNGSSRLKFATVKEGKNGKQTISLSDTVTGTASDNQDGEYKFIYLNSATYDYNGSRVNVHMVDNFTVVGESVNYSVSFEWGWAFETDDFGLEQTKDNSGKLINVSISPEIFATADGETEDPNVIKGSWEKFSTYGDPFNCDPL